jgi:protein translocase SecG subunit
MKNVLMVSQIILALSITILILVQSKGTGFGRAWGSSSVSFTRRGLEKIVYRATFILSALFILVSLLQLVY